MFRYFWVGMSFRDDAILNIQTTDSSCMNAKTCSSCPIAIVAYHFLTARLDLKTPLTSIIANVQDRICNFFQGDHFGISIDYRNFKSKANLELNTAS